MDLIKEMEQNKYIRVKEQKAYNLESLNFSNKAFYKSVWNEFTIKARGLFVDKDTKEVKIRSYDKFFNYNENALSNDEYIFNHVAYPVCLFQKYNGFLGMMSVIDNDIVLATKSSLSGVYVEYFKETFYSVLTAEQINWLKTIAIQGYTCVFEVLNVQDKHIIDFDKNDLVLLDVLPNKLFLDPDTDYAFSPFALDEAAAKGIKTKQLLKMCLSAQELRESIDYYTSLNAPLEGFVAQDAQGYMFKVKTHYYVLLKRYRRAIEFAKKCGIEKANKKYQLGIKPEYLDCKNIIEVQEKYHLV